ncbi:VCL [Cordylochernes scorpioides]|uniref:Vinculin n=1 Tax=Cordylochernes scorpioides TaxID=51811 RepID=A0ABY6LQQ2_9ARAC|nr:VCL [Cordylochernes scorpioides]
MPCAAAPNMGVQTLLILYPWIRSPYRVSRLVILHEEAEDGNAMPDLSRPVDAVSKAVANLVNVGKETISSSDDVILRQDMPPALQNVERASRLLEDACGMLRADPFSQPARKILIEGSRGILQGTSALLLCFDESEVRKIIRECKKVLDYLAVSEVIENMDDLVKFVKDLSPSLTKVFREVDAREKELTHQVHREILCRCLEALKTLAPILICSMKIYVQIASQGGKGAGEAAENRNYLSSRMVDEINEIIRVLQLTTYDEDEWDADNLTVMKRAQTAIDSRLQSATDWLMDPTALTGGLGEKSLRHILDLCRRAADHALPLDREAIHKALEDIISMVNALCQLRQEGKGTTPQAQSLSRELHHQLTELCRKVGQAVQNLERSGHQQPAHTVGGRVEQAMRWLAAPHHDDKGLGLQAVRLILEEGRKLAESCAPHQRAEIQALCRDIENLTRQLTDMCNRGQLCTVVVVSCPFSMERGGAIATLVSQISEFPVHGYRSGSGLTTPYYRAVPYLAMYYIWDVSQVWKQGNTPQALALARTITAKLTELRDRIQRALVNRVVDDFIDINTPLKQFTEAVLAPEGTPNREINFQDKALSLQDFSRRVATTARDVATGTAGNKRLAQALMSSSVQVESLTPQLVNAGRIRLNYPENKAADEHFENLRKQYAESLQKMRYLADIATDTVSFIRATEDAILYHTNLCEDAISHRQPPQMVDNTAAIARLANRVLMVARQEADNSEDPLFVNRVNMAAARLQDAVAPMVQNAKTVALDITSPAAIARWREANKAPQRARLSSRPHHHCWRWSLLPAPPPPPEMAPPRPPPPETDDEFEARFPSPLPNQPIMMAAHGLHQEVRQWSSKDNEIIAAAKRMALLMAQLSQCVRRGDRGSKKELIACARAIAEASEEVTRLAKEQARMCTDKRMRTNILQVCERIPTIGTQLRILSTVKATMLGAQAPIPTPDGSEIICGTEEDQEATDMLVGNAQNLMQSVKETVRACEAASIKIRTDSGVRVRWIRKQPWYN